jgi:hypothetical protein
MSQYVFGTGQLFAMPVGGGAPLRFGALQDVSVDFNGDIKELYGQYQFALDVARGKTKIEWKASSGNIDVNAFNTIFFGQTVTTGSELLQVFNEAGTIPATPFQLTAVHGANFVMDLGVYDATTGLPLKQVPSGPTTGQYSVSVAGVYTFAAADTTKAVLLNYLWTSASTGGSLAVGNQLMGVTPRFQLVLSQTYEGSTFSLILYSNVANKLSLPIKQEDYMMADISGQSFADAANRVARLTTTSIVGGGA